MVSMIYLELKTAELTEKAVSIFFVGCMFSHMMTQPPPLAFTVTEDTWGRCRACRCDTMAWEQRCLVLPRLNDDIVALSFKVPVVRYSYAGILVARKCPT